MWTWLIFPGLFCALAQSAVGQGMYLPIDQVKAGAVGTGKSTFQGTTIEEFQVEILGVLRNLRPGRNLILARLKGDKIEATGVFSGMSGSPVYIDGKLIGAIAYSFPFAKEPIAGITPIHEMLDIFQKEPGAGSRSSALSFSTRSERLGEPPAQPSLHTAQPLQAFGVMGDLLPIATPLSLSGFSPLTLNYFQAHLRSLGLQPVTGLTTPGYDLGKTQIAPGSTLVAQLIRGDLDVSAAGTVTHIDGARVYAFGHPFVGSGFTDMPMASGAVMTVISRLSNSDKITAVGNQVGSIKQDRDTGVLGLQGEKAQLLPVSIHLKTSRSGTRDINVEMVRGSFLSPLLTNLAVFNSLASSERAIGPQTFRVETTIAIAGQPDVHYSRNSATMVEAALSVGGILDLLLNTGFENVPVDSIRVEIRALEESLSATLEQVWIDKREVRPGDAVQLTLILRSQGGKAIHQDYTLKVPEDLEDGPLQMMVGEGISISKSSLAKDDAQFVPQTLYQLVRAINNLKKNDRLYVRLFRKRPGAVIEGEGMPLLPPSMLEIHNSERTTGASLPLENVVFLEQELAAMDFVLEGVKTVELIVKS